MKVAEIQHEIERLPEDQQDYLAAFLLALRLRREGTFAEVRERLDDTRPEKWIPWSKAKSELGIDGADPNE